MRIHKHIILLFLIATSFCLKAQEEIRFTDASLKAILSIAKERKKNVFIDTYADWCKPCKRMKKVFQNKDVATFYNEHFINLRVNMQNSVKANELRRKYDVVFLPTLMIVDPDGNLKYYVDREISASEMLNAGQKVLDEFRGNSTIAASTGKQNNSKKTAPKSTNPPRKEPKKEKSIKKTEVVKNTKSVPSTPPNTVSESEKKSDENILYVLGKGEVPPPFLREEAYLRLQFMDGSHRQVAKKYLQTQNDWNTPENRKFIVDFINATESQEYEFLIKNKPAFIAQFGEDKINHTLEILTYKALYKAVVRPSFEQCKELVNNYNPSISDSICYNYYIKRLMTEDSTVQVKTVTADYLNQNPDDIDMRFQIADHFLNMGTATKDDYKYAISLLESREDSNSENHYLFEKIGDLYQLMGKNKKASKYFKKAKAIAESKNLNTSSIEIKLESI